LHFKEVPKWHSIILPEHENRNQLLGLRLDRAAIPGPFVGGNLVCFGSRRTKGREAVTRTSALARA
jgi:hypothetical protein